MLNPILLKIVMYMVFLTLFVTLFGYYERRRSSQTNTKEHEESIYLTFARVLLPAMVFAAVADSPWLLDLDFKGWLANLVEGVWLYIWPDSSVFKADAIGRLISVLLLVAMLVVLAQQLFSRLGHKDDKSRPQGGSTTWSTVSPFLTLLLIVFIAESLISLDGGNTTLSGWNLYHIVQNVFTNVGNDIFTVTPVP